MAGAAYASHTRIRGGDVARSVGPAGRMRIGRALGALRERAGLTQAQVAAAASVSVGTVNRYEAWQDRSALRIPTVRAIADACGASDEEREELVRVASTHDEGWWLETAAALPEILSPLVSFESYAAYEHVWANQLVPGLLQTPAYALALHQAAHPRTDTDTIRATVDARMRRQEVLGADLHLWVVLKESVLQDRVGSGAVMAEQIGHLIDASREPHITVQVLPHEAGHVAGAGGGHFVILGREDTADPMASMSVVYLELLHRGLYLDAGDDVREYRMIFDHLRSEAASAAHSRTLMDHARQEHTR